MESRWIEMANELEKGGSTMAFCIAKQRAKEKRDIIGVPMEISRWKLVKGWRCGEDIVRG